MIQVETGTFQGPLELLLKLVEKSKIDIEEIVIADITQAFLDAMSEMTISMDEITGFIEIASTLLFLKSKSLLPEPEDTDEEEVTRAQLIERLKLYKQFREAARSLALCAKNAPVRYGKRQEDLDHYRMDSKLVIEKDIHKLHDIFIELMIQDQVDHHLRDAIVDQVMDTEQFSVSETLVRLLELLDKNSLSSLRSYIHTNHTKSELIALFLSVLELIKAGEVSCVQFDRRDLFVRRVR